MTDQQKEMLQEMAAIAMDEIEIRLEARKNARNMVELLNETLVNLRETSRAVTKLPEANKTAELTALVSEAANIITNIENTLTEQRKIEL